MAQSSSVAGKESNVNMRQIYEILHGVDLRGETFLLITRASEEVVVSSSSSSQADP